MVGFLRQLRTAADERVLLSVSLSRPRADAGCEKVVIRPVVVRNEPCFQFAFRNGKQETHENLAADRAVDRVAELLESSFHEARLLTPTADYVVRTKPSGRVTLKQFPASRPAAADAGHNRTKNYLIPEGVPCRFLQEIGVMTAEGRVHAAKSRKFRQVNRFLELIDDVIRGFPEGEPLNIVDFGCGKSYLTFALHHLVREIRGRDVQIVGLDREASVIKSCRRVAERLDCRDLSFQIGDIAGYEATQAIDLVVSLHACDTATDDALAKAVGWNARAILAVPCCQHDLFATMQPEQFTALSRHGILKERFAALATDAMRAELLECHGYRTQVVEFIDMEHTAKNLLIRAVRRTGGNRAPRERLESYRELKQTLGVASTPLEARIGEMSPETASSIDLVPNVRIAYLDCSTGIAGDMTLAALIDSGVDADAIREGIASLGLDGVSLNTESVTKEGFRATYVTVTHPEQHAHRHLSDIVKMIDAATAISDKQKATAKQIFHAVGVAEARVHGTTIDRVHFHEVGAIDSIVDIVGAAIAFDLLGAERVFCSPLPTGRGKIHIDHGICTVPAPATAELLKGIPLADIPVDAELTTPTGAAIAATLVDGFRSLPAMTVESIGYGAGTMNLPQRANLLRIFVGTQTPSPLTDRVCLLETNLDDVSGEIIGHTKQRLLAAGALDVYSIPIQMKKDRPGTILSVISREADVEPLEAILFSETATFGIRRMWVDRSIRAREERTVDTVWGPVRGKLGWRTGESPVFTPEFDDCAKLAAEKGLFPMQIVAATSGLESVVLGMAILFVAFLLRRNAVRGRKSQNRDIVGEVREEFLQQEKQGASKLEKLELRLYDYSREVEARIETRIALLDQLVVAADAETTRLESQLKLHLENADEAARQRATPEQRRMIEHLAGLLSKRLQFFWNRKVGRQHVRLATELADFLRRLLGGFERATAVNEHIRPRAGEFERDFPPDAGETYGEVVFNTSMTGYQEILTDPSYCGQIVSMTYPQIGNYGVNPDDVESSGISLRGFIVRELCRRPSNYRSTQTLDEYLAAAGVIGMEGIDTRSLVRRIRVHGAMTGVLSTTDLDDASLVAKAQSSPELVGQDLVSNVMPTENYGWNEGLSELARTPAEIASAAEGNQPSGEGKHVVAIDYGMKWNIPRHLRELGLKVTVVPGTATAEEVLEHKPDGVFLSNGPGDPRPLTYAVETIRNLLGKQPIFGICLGQQLLGQAFGGEIFKLKFGHRGANQPVLNKLTGRVEITTQNHGFALSEESLGDDVEITHVNLNDDTVEGIRHRKHQAFGVQYHPESSAGPHDSRYLFDDFLHAITSA
eukprot:g33030.t1